MHEATEKGSKGGMVASGRAGVLLGEVAVTFRAKGAVLRAAGRENAPLVRGYGALRRAEAALIVARGRLLAQEGMETATLA